MSLVLDEHREYLADTPRVVAFKAAIAKVVKSGDAVLDLGCGSGILGLIAAQAGATRVYSVDDGAIIQFARDVARANGLAKRIVHIRALSTRIDLPEKVDVVIADQSGRFGFEAGVVQYFADARKRFLKPGGRMIPARIDLQVAPVQCAQIRAQIESWGRRPAGFDFGPARAIAENTGYPFKYHPDDLLGGAATVMSFDLAAGVAPTVHGAVSIPVIRAGNLDGIGGWFSAELAPGVTMTNSPLSEQRINRHNVFMPIKEQVRVEPGDRVSVVLQITPQQVQVTWKVEVITKEGMPEGKFTHSTMRGMLLSREDMEKTKPTFVPTLTRWGDARRSVVNLCDGRRTFSEIEAEIYRRHRELFGSLAEASVFVTEVIMPYAV